jgi:hypothetical protein
VGGWVGRAWGAPGWLRRGEYTTFLKTTVGGYKNIVKAKMFLSVFLKKGGEKGVI